MNLNRRKAGRPGGLMARAITLGGLLLGLWAGPGPAAWCQQPDPASPPAESKLPAVEEPSPTSPPYRRPAVVPLEGEINSWNFETFKRRVDDALADNADLVIVPIDTPGGELGAAFDFGNYIFNKVRPRARIVFFVTNHALSAGALIALAGHEIFMGPGGSIGDCQPIFMTSEGIKEGPEKIQTAIRATFRKYAQANGYPIALAESMISKEIEVLELKLAGEDEPRFVRADDFETWPETEKKKVESRKIAVKEGELLTMTADDAVRFRFVKKNHNDIQDLEELGRRLGLGDASLKPIEPTWSEEMVRTVQAWNFLLILIGLLCLYLEFKTPGFGFFGVAGIAAFAVYFFFGHLTGLSDYWEIALCVVGLILIGLEIFVVPGFGIPGVLGIGCVLVGLFAGGLPNEFVIPSVPYQYDMFEAALIKFASVVAGAVVLAVLISKFLPDMPVLNRLVLSTPAEAPHTEAIAGREAAGGEVAVGGRGTALSPLRPTGTAQFGATRIDVVTRGEFIEKGAALRVVQTAHNRIVVVEDEA